jgi:hypothetical protein
LIVVILMRFYVLIVCKRGIPSSCYLYIIIIIISLNHYYLIGNLSYSNSQIPESGVSEAADIVETLDRIGTLGVYHMNWLRLCE